MFGQYQNFPESVHYVAEFSLGITNRRLQHAIIKTFKHLNESLFKLNAIVSSSQAEWDISFELGLADGLNFNFIDKEEIERFQDIKTKEALPILDFLCITGCRIINNRKRGTRRFDYHFLRFIFRRNNMELHIFHEKGFQRIPLEELAVFIMRCIREELCREGFKRLTLRELRTL